MSGLIRLLIAFLFLFFVLSGYFFVRLNMSPVELWLGVAFPARPVGQWLLLMFLLGGLLGLIIGVGLLKRFQQKVQISYLKNQVKKLTVENSRLKKASIKDFLEE